jgi:hypothetical protein
MRVGVGEEVLRRIELNQLSRLEKDDPIVVHDGTKSMSDGDELERIGTSRETTIDQLRGRKLTV